MSTQFKNSLVISMALIFLGACSTRVSKDIIESYKAENAFYEISLKEKAISKEDLLRETEDNYDQLISEIDPVKKEIFLKDSLFQRDFDNRKRILVELADKIQINIALTSANIATGNRFIESLNSGEVNNVEVARRQWEDLKLQFSSLQKENDLIQAKITDIKDQLYELSSNALKKYSSNKKSN